MHYLKLLIIVLISQLIFSSCENQSSSRQNIKMGQFQSNENDFTNYYKTPNGSRYHKSTCRMVDNFSSRLESQNEINQYRLTPCKICKPKSVQSYSGSYNAPNESVGTQTAMRCKGITKKGNRCKHKTKLANGYCFQHGEQSN